MRRSRQRHSLYSERADTAEGPRGGRVRTIDEEAARRRRQWGLGLVGGTAIVTSIAVMPGIAAAGAAASAAAPVGVATTAGTRAEPAAVRVAAVPAAPAQQPDAAPGEAFTAAGYTYEDALVLASYWGVDSELDVKAIAGELLAAGTPLAESRFADPTGAEGFAPEELAELFLISGYDVEDAAVLAEAWGVTVGEAKTRAGTELKVVGVLPFVDPAPMEVEAGDLVMPADFQAFFDAGYDYDDSVLLAEHWGLPSFVEAKAEAGRLLLAGEPLPDVSGVAPA